MQPKLHLHPGVLHGSSQVMDPDRPPVIVFLRFESRSCQSAAPSLAVVDTPCWREKFYRSRGLYRQFKQEDNARQQYCAPTTSKSNATDAMITCFHEVTASLRVAIA